MTTAEDTVEPITLERAAFLAAALDRLEEDEHTDADLEALGSTPELAYDEATSEFEGNDWRARVLRWDAERDRLAAEVERLRLLVPSEAMAGAIMEAADAADFYDRVLASSPDDQNAVGTDHMKRVRSACERVRTAANNDGWDRAALTGDEA